MVWLLGDCHSTESGEENLDLIFCCTLLNLLFPWTTLWRTTQYQWTIHIFLIEIFIRFWFLPSWGYKVFVKFIWYIGYKWWPVTYQSYVILTNNPSIQLEIMDSQEQEVQEEIKEPQEEDNPEATQKGKKNSWSFFDDKLCTTAQTWFNWETTGSWFGDSEFLRLSNL